ncbi:MAG: Ni/Fe hydrogenase subunit alpha, partial [Planctomycetota bacterium]
PRYFEVMLKNKHYAQAPFLASRICGICSISHTLTSLRAVENAFDVTIPETAAKLRLLGCHGETLQSHVLHLLFLAAPDFLGKDSVLPLIEEKPEVVQIALRLKGVANCLCDIVAGRTTHPVSFHVGGVSAVPKKEDLHLLHKALNRCLIDLDAVEELFASIDLPEFERETEFVSLKGENDYPFIGGDLVSSDGVKKAEADYAAMTREYVVENNTSKWTRLSRESYAVGALARFNNNSRFLHANAARVAARFRLTPVNHNPFMNHIAQLVECFHIVYDALRLVEELLDAPCGEIMAEVVPREGEGVGAVEAPRGLLIHHYTFDASGMIRKADCVVPTTQNNANIHLDLKDLVKSFAKEGMNDTKLELLCSMLVRAYDPCVSCSVH